MTNTLWIIDRTTLPPEVDQVVVGARAAGMPRDVEGALALVLDCKQARYQKYDRQGLAQGTANLVLMGMAFEDQWTCSDIVMIFDICGLKWIVLK